MKKYIVLVILVMMLIPMNAFGKFDKIYAVYEKNCSISSDKVSAIFEEAEELIDDMNDAIDNKETRSAINFADKAIRELYYAIEQNDLLHKSCRGIGPEAYRAMQERVRENSIAARKAIRWMEDWIEKAEKNLAEANDSIEQSSFEQDYLSFDGYYDAEENERRIKELENAKVGEKNRNFYVTEYRRLHGEDPKRMSVNVEKASFYSGPGTNYELLWEAEKYFPVLIVDIKGSWYKIMDVEGDMAWIDKSFLGEKDYGIITTSGCLAPGCFVLSLPKKDSQTLFSIDMGVPFKVLSHSGDYFKIEHVSGSIGWIYLGYIW